MRRTNEDGGYYFDPEDQAALSQEGSGHSVYAVRADGSFAVDAMTGKPYAPAVCTVDFGSILTDSAIHITDYEVISDERNNLYVVWSDTTKKDENAAIVSCDESMALELYATARIAEEDLASADPENPAYHARWSKPFRLTREQLVTILERYARYKGMDVSESVNSYLVGFADANTISDWAVKAFRWAVHAGIINGVGGSRLSPATDATRAQVATMLMRFENLPREAPARRSANNNMRPETQ